MNHAMASLRALPFEKLGRHPDLLLAGLIATAVGMLIVPLPPAWTDLFLALNLTLSALILIAVLLADRALALSSFPTLLLLTTLFRLALNVSTTRLILTEGHAGEVIKAFGALLLRGDVVVGMVLFLVITIVQFLVIAKGAERVAEVGARFTLDAMPGKQMSIDAAARSGSITEDEAQAKRDELSRESQFHGAMDGAMKFVKGDAIAALIITAVNLAAGSAIGVFRFKLPFGAAVDHYCVLSVGDGLVSQIPALLITLAAGVLTTRVRGSDRQADLGMRLQSELLSRPKVSAIGAVFALLFGLIPGLPLFPFLLIATVLAFIAYWTIGHEERRRGSPRGSKEERAIAVQEEVDEKVREIKSQRALADSMAPAVIPIAIDVDPKLSSALRLERTSDPETELLGSLIPQLRDALYLETGIRFPCVRIRSNAPGLEPGTIVIRIKDVPVVMESVYPDLALAIEHAGRLGKLGIDAKPAQHPLNGSAAAWIPAEHGPAVEASGVMVWSAAGVIALHLARELKKHARGFVGLQETSELIERLEKVYPALVREVVPKCVTLSQLTDILRRLVDEAVSIRDLKTILEALADYGSQAADGVELTELVRSALSLQIGHAHAGLSRRLPVLLLDPVIEDTVRSAITATPGGTCLALDPEIRRMIIGAVMQTISPVLAAGVRPIILTSAEIRRYVRKLLEEDVPEAAILSFQELPSELTIHPLGRVMVTALG